MNRLLKSWRLSVTLLGLSATVVLAGCNNIQSVNAPDTIPIQSINHDPYVSSEHPFIKCPPYNPEQTMCTAQYDPVCVKVKTRSGTNYRTAGNACSACGTMAALGYVKGECSPPEPSPHP